MRPPDAIVQPDRLIRLGEVIDLAGLGKTMIYRKVRDGSFPAPFNPGGVSSRWSEREVQEWRENLRRKRIGTV